jgi:predicted permease
MRHALVVSEVALAFVLLVGAGLLIRSFVGLQTVPPGFTAAGVLTMELSMTGRRYADPGDILEAYRQIWERLAALPGVTAAGGVSMLPLSQMFAWGPIVLEGRPLPSGESFVNVDQRTVGGAYFSVMQIPLLKGRLFTEHDTLETPRVVVIDDQMASVLWPGEDPIGKRLRRGGMDSDAAAPWLTVVGIVGRVKQYTLDERDSRIAMYHPHTQSPSRALNVVIRARAPDQGSATAVREIRAVDPDLPIYNLKTMESRVDESLARRRFAMLLLAFFAGIALVLAAVGVYGVMAYLVDQGTRDIGIRMALGAAPSRIVTMVVGHAALVAAIALAVGLAAAASLAGLMRNLLFGVEPIDPLTFGGAALLLMAVALVGGFVPARRAARVNPAVACRGE